MTIHLATPIGNILARTALALANGEIDDDTAKNVVDAVRALSRFADGSPLADVAGGTTVRGADHHDRPLTIFETARRERILAFLGFLGARERGAEEAHE